MIFYRTVEHFFQAMKFKDVEHRKSIAAMLSPFAAKKEARQCRSLIREDWMKIRDSVMWTALCWKFRKGTRWGDLLISTYSKDLVEWNNWHDNYWGWCICPRCYNSVLNPDNRLGEMLEKRREELL
jgi:ribA/ribD-fused uncharacterized protein